MGHHGVDHGKQLLLYPSYIILDMCGYINYLNLLKPIHILLVKLSLYLNVLKVLLDLVPTPAIVHALTHWSVALIAYLFSICC